MTAVRDRLRSARKFAIYDHAEHLGRAPGEGVIVAVASGRRSTSLFKASAPGSPRTLESCFPEAAPDPLACHFVPFTAGTYA